MEISRKKDGVKLEMSRRKNGVTEEINIIF